MSDVIRILILSDHKPGHLSSSIGVLKSIEKLAAVDAVTLGVTLRFKFLRYPLRVMLNRDSTICRIPLRLQQLLIRFCYKIEFPEQLAAAVAHCEWILSSGGDTSFLNAWIARAYSINNIYCSSLRGLKPELFTLIISIQSGPARSNEIKTPIPPAPVDRDQLRVRGRRFRETKHLDGGPVWAVLIGGDGAGYHFARVDMEQMADGLVALAARHDARLLITTSRRTGSKLEDVLRQRLLDQPTVKYATYYNHRPEKVVAEFLGSADMVFCTADSGSMITEAITAGRPVYALEPQRVRSKAFYRLFLNQLDVCRHIKRIPIEQLSLIDIKQDQSSYFQLLEKDTIHDLAEKIKPWILS